MKFIDLVKLSIRMFKARTSRTVLTIIGIGVGTATILFLISLGFGIQEIILNKITTNDSLSTIDVLSGSQEKDKIDWEDIEKISQVKEINRIIPVAKYEGQIKIGDYNNNTSFLVTEPGFLAMDGKHLIAGEDLSYKDDLGVVLSSSIAKTLQRDPEELLASEVEIVLNIPEEKLGRFTEKKIDKKFKIVGVIENDKSQVYFNLNNLGRANVNNLSLIKIKVPSIDYVDGVKKQVEIFGYKTASVSEVVQQAKKFFAVTSSVLAVLGVIALLVSSIGMFNTMVITLLERTEEIGIMKAIGATNGNILSIFVVESALMGFLGGFSGVVMGFLVQIIFNFTINFIAVKMGGEVFQLFYTPPWFVILLMLVSLFIGILTGLIPARKASVIDPLEALRRR